MATGIFPAALEHESCWIEPAPHLPVEAIAEMRVNELDRGKPVEPRVVRLPALAAADLLNGLVRGGPLISLRVFPEHGRATILFISNRRIGLNHRAPS